MAPVDYFIGSDQWIGNDDGDIIPVEPFGSTKTYTLNFDYISIYLQDIIYFNRPFG